MRGIDDGVEDEVRRAPLEDRHPGLGGKVALRHEVAFGHVARLPRRCRPEELDEDISPVARSALTASLKSAPPCGYMSSREDGDVELRQVADHLLAIIFEVLGDLRHQHRPGPAVGRAGVAGTGAGFVRCGRLRGGRVGPARHRAAGAPPWRRAAWRCGSPSGRAGRGSARRASAAGDSRASC